jgi:Protein of unknown function (DUF3619)
MNEKEFSQKVTHTLNWGLSHIEEDRLAKLRAARQQAMAHYREPINVLGLVMVSGQTLNLSSWARKPLFWLPILAIVALLATYSFTGDDDIVDESGELDARLLTGELPINAFLDKDFQSWVKDSSH